MERDMETVEMYGADHAENMRDAARDFMIEHKLSDKMMEVYTLPTEVMDRRPEAGPVVKFRGSARHQTVKALEMRGLVISFSLSPYDYHFFRLTTQEERAAGYNPLKTSIAELAAHWVLVNAETEARKMEAHNQELDAITTGHVIDAAEREAYQIDGWMS